jgi:predicted AlkP superfamily pyrophosphatase or phosphodiesterase
LQRHGPFELAANVSSRHPQSQPRAHERSHQLSLNPKIVPDLRAMDDIAGQLIQFFEARGVGVVLLSEYGITNVDTPVHLNRIFREQGWLTVKDELGLEVLDAGASRAFAVADHQVAHVYLNDRALEKPVREVLEKTPGVDGILGEAEKSAAGLAHPRAGDLIAVAAENAWFTYYYWLEDARAPDFARTVDIHRKPGYDPVELFLDPKIQLPQLKIAWRLLQKRLGLRMLMDVVPLDAALVKGSHGRRPAQKKDWPVIITSQPELLDTDQIQSTDVFQILLRHLAEKTPWNRQGTDL